MTSLNHLKKLLQDSSIYGVGILASKMIGFLLLPVYTSYLSPEDYGVLAILDLIGMYFGIVVGAGFSSAFMRYYHEHNSGDWHNIVFITCLITVLILGLFCGSIAITFSSWLSQMLFESDIYKDYLILVLAAVILDVIISVCLTLFRVKEYAFKYVKISLLRLIIGASLNILFIVYFDMGIWGFVVSNFITGMIISSFVVVYLLVKFWKKPSLKLAKEMFLFSAPFIPMGLVEVFLHSMGIVCLKQNGDLAAVGLFAVGKKIGSIVSLLHQPLGMVWTPYMYKIGKQPNAPRIYAQITTYIVLALSAIVLIIGIFSENLTELMTSENFTDASEVITPIAIGYLIYNLRPGIRIGLSLAKKTHYFPFLIGLPVIPGFLLCLLMSKKYGAIGAAWGMAFTMTIIILFTALVSRRDLIVPYEMKRLAKVALVIGICLVASKTLLGDSIIFKICVVLLFPLVLFISNFFTNDEKGSLIRLSEHLFAKLGINKIN